MNERQEIRRLDGHIVGYYEISSNGDKTIRDFYGKILGYYETQRNVTKTFYGNIICYGDASGAFFKDMLDM
ncbi:MAG: hypothetical protein J6X19_06750 [Clostridia bacterium]|nr:hypothetical protein [Clostridia bacterium]